MRFYLTILYVTVIVLTCFSKERAPKPENRFSFSAGIGPSYSIWNDKLLVDGADTIFKGSYYFKKKKASGINIFGEFSCMFRRNFYLTVGIDYNQFSKKYGYNTRYRSPDYQNEISFDYYGNLTDHNTSIQFAINKKIAIKKHSIHIGTGIFFMFLREPYILIGFQPPPYQTNFTVSNTAHAEFGFPFQLCYEYAINKKWSVGFKTQYQYILSTRNSQNVYFSPYFRLNIQKMEKKRNKIIDVKS
ncbi:MAG TPA: hypothetical protein PKA15_11545 [Chitinophagales bacterium]|nr:hypothetical protein [Chitinophagales bacterium]HMW95570.1 hypothetical protein [Chitinophagales bacterium]HMY43753.1 hypothetical protein [Chitinophagales bacterium]HMZ95290.1 hypothetical protein [Chitinophagales bacterium]HNG09633.1 hypothetical protein [Chitinophagales bacterium]